MPILITDNEQVLFESDAIVEYLDEEVGEPLFSADPVKKAQERAWSYLASKHYLVQCSTQRSADAATLEERASKLSTAFGKISTQLGNGTYINGETMGMVEPAGCSSALTRPHSVGSPPNGRPSTQHLSGIEGHAQLVHNGCQQH